MNLHRDNDGTCMVSLGELPVLASYSVEFGDVAFVGLTTNGVQIGIEHFSAEQITEWEREITADRDSDERSLREAVADQKAMGAADAKELGGVFA